MAPAAPAAPYRLPPAYERRTVRCKFFYHQRPFAWVEWSTCADVEVLIPLQPAEATALESTLRSRLNLPTGHTVFGLRRLDERFSAPALPLILLHGLVDTTESRVAFSTVVRCMAQLSLPRPQLPPGEARLITLDALLQGDNASQQLLCRTLQRDGVAVVRSTAALHAAVRELMAVVPALMAKDDAQKASMHHLLNPRDPHDRR